MRHAINQASTLGILLAMSASSQAMAQSSGTETPAAPATDSRANEGIEDIIVTAQKRAEHLQDVPIAITALSSDALASAGVTDVPSLQIAVPGLAFAQSAGYSLPRIRGVGTGANGPGVENSVAVYVDNVYIAATSSGMMSFNNIAQLAVLKGPQGTLFGRNATGGVIQITTRDPGQDLTLDASAGIANRSTFQGNLYAAVPIADTAAIDLAVFYRDQQDGTARNLNTGNDVGQGSDFAIRSKIKWDPSDTTTIRLLGDYALSKGVRFLNRPLPGSISAGGNIFLPPKFAVQSTFDPRQRISQKGVSLQIDQQIDDFSLISITALRRGNFFVNFDSDTQPAPLTNVTINQFDRQFSQEFQLLSPKDGPLTWMVGAYYLDASSGHRPQRTINRTAPFLAPPTIATFTSKMTTRSIAGFGQATYGFSDSTNLTAGLRYTSDERKAAVSRTVQLPNGVIVPASDARSATFEKLTWRLSLDHRFSEQLLGYLSYNRGFKSGLFAPTGLPLVEIAPEVLDAYEVGFKADLLDRRLRINAALFHYDYTNLQVVRIVGGVPTLFSGPKAKIDGIDADFSLRVDSRLLLTGGASWLDSRFTNFPQAVFTTPLPGGGNSLAFGDAAGNRLPMTPRWTTNLGFNYTVPTGIGEIAIDGAWQHNDGYFEGPENRIRQKPFDLINGSIGWTSRSGNLRASIWGKNLLDTFYATQFSAQPTQDALIWGDRRTFGLTLGLKI